MSIRVPCPFCNSAVVLPGRPASGRATCPRCGEGFPVKAAEEIDAPLSDGLQPPEFAKRADAPRIGSLSTAKILLLSILFGAVALGAGYYFFRSPGGPPAQQPQNETHPPGTTPPLSLAGLRYLPSGANVLFAVQPAPLLAYAERTKTDPKALLTSAGVPAEFITLLDRLGVRLDQIDHVAGGLTLANDSLFPGLALVLKLRRPVANEETFLQALKAEKKPKTGRATYTVALAGLPLTMTRIDDRTYLFGLLEKDLTAADNPSATPALPRDLREALATRLSPASFAWAATDADRWADKAAVKGFLLGAKDPKTKDWAGKLTQGRQAAAGLSLEPNPQLRVAIRTQDADTAKTLRNYFAEKLAGDPATISGEADWAEADIVFDPKTGGGVFRKLLPNQNP
jgi:hypothetical protein